MFFHALTYAGSRGCCLNTSRLLGRALKHFPRHPANVNAMEQTYLIVVLHILLDSNINCTEKRRLNIRISIFLHWISLNKMASVSIFRTPLRCHNIIDARNVLADKSMDKMISQGCNAFLF